MSRNAEIVTARTFNAANISISAQNVMKSGAKSSYLNYNRGGFFIQSPSLSVPMGLSCFVNDKTGQKDYSLQLGLRGYDEEGTKAKEFHDMMVGIDEYMLKEGVKNSKDWFGKQCSMELVQDKYSPCIKASKSVDKAGNPYPPSFRLKLKQDEAGNFLFDNVVNKKKEKIEGKSFEEIFGRNCKVTCLLKASMVWFTNAGYGITWKPEQIRIDEEVANMNVAPAMIDEDGDDDVVAVAAPVQVKKPVAAPTQTLVDDDEVFQTKTPAKSAIAAVMPADDEDEDEDEDEDVPAVPVPKKTTTVLPKKKIIAKK
jgi:hypothetical protein